MEQYHTMEYWEKIPMCGGRY